MKTKLNTATTKQAAVLINKAVKAGFTRNVTKHFDIATVSLMMNAGSYTKLIIVQFTNFKRKSVSIQSKRIFSNGDGKTFKGISNALYMIAQ